MQHLNILIISLLISVSSQANDPGESFVDSGTPEGSAFQLNTFDKKSNVWKACELSVPRGNQFAKNSADGRLKISVGVFSGARAEGAEGEPIVASDNAICTNNPASSATSEKVDPRTLPDDGSVWRVGTNRWSLEEEDRFAKWIEKNVDKDFMKTFGLETDCADAPTVIRAIYARIRSLPQVYTDGKIKAGHFSKNWKDISTVTNWTEDNWKESLKTDRRFRSFINYSGGMLIGTATLPYNTYPVKINADLPNKGLSRYVHAGTIILQHDFHARFISKIDPNSARPITEMSSTVPRSVRQLSEYAVYSIPNRVISEGLINWRWPVNCGDEGWKLTPPVKMPGYSTEQYEINDLTTTVISLARNKSAQAKPEDVTNLIKQLDEYVAPRVATVLSAEPILASGNPMSEQQIDEFSTPTRDTNIQTKIADLYSFVESNRSTLAITPAELDRRLSEKIINIGHSQKTSLYLIKRYGLESSPTATHAERWKTALLRAEYNRLKVKTPLGPRDRADLEALRKVFE